MSQQQGVALARITPVQRTVQVGRAAEPGPRVLSHREKAAVIVRLILSEGSSIPLSELPETMQAELAQQIGQMKMIDRSTLDAVVTEFLAQLEDVGLSFPGGIEGALNIMDGHISTSAATRLRRMAGPSSRADPWERLVNLPAERLLPVLEEESVEVAAVMLSKLPVPLAAELLGKLPGEKARRVAYAVSMTGNVDPETVQRIGQSLAVQLHNQPPKAFEAGPVERVGAILNVSPALTREDVLRGLDEADQEFADQVRKAIFTFTHIPDRLNARDVPKIMRLVEQPMMVSALAAALTNPTQAPTAEFFLNNISQRMAQGLREEIQGRGKVKEKDAEEAMNTIINVIRQLEATSEIVLITEEE